MSSYGDAQDGGDGGGAYGGSMPKIDLYGTGNVDLRTVAPLYGVTSEEEPEYLDYDIKGRGTIERMFLYSGSSYLGGIISGGTIGARNGWRAAPSPKFWIRFNSVMNGASKLGSKWGNNAGVIAMMYSFFEGMADNFEAEKYMGGHPASNSALAGFITGSIYKATAANKRATLLAGVLGGVGGGAMYFLRGAAERFYFR